MDTNKLIDMMASDARVPEPVGKLPLLRWLAPATLLSLVVMWLSLGPRDELASVMSSNPFAMKIVLALLFFAPALLLAYRAYFPENNSRNGTLYLLVPVAATVGLFSVALAGMPSEQWPAAIVGSTLAACLASIPLLALPMLGAILWGLRQGASTHPQRAGLIAGCCAGGLAIAIYTLHCTEDNPAFFALWYPAGVGIAALIGYWLGPRVLKW